MLTISGKTLGSKRPLFADFHVPPPAGLSGGGGTTLRDLIESVVRHEVAAFQQRQADRQFVRVLTEGQIADAAAAGKIEAGGSEVAPQEVDPELAVATALQAFEDGIFLVVIDDQEQRTLDQEVFVQPDSRLTFIRLSMLAGG